MSPGEAGAGLTLYGEGLSDACNFPNVKSAVITGDGAIVSILEVVGDLEGDTLVGKRTLVGLG